MLQTLANISLLVSLLMLIPALHLAFLTLQDRSRSLRYSSYYQYFLLQLIYHAGILILYLIFPVFNAACAISLFALTPLLVLLAFKRYHLNWKKDLVLDAKKHVLQREHSKKLSDQRKKRKAIRIPKRSEYRWR